MISCGRQLKAFERSVSATDQHCSVTFQGVILKHVVRYVLSESRLVFRYYFFKILRHLLVDISFKEFCLFGSMLTGR